MCFLKEGHHGVDVDLVVEGAVGCCDVVYYGEEGRGVDVGFEAYLSYGLIAYTEAYAESGEEEEDLVVFGEDVSEFVVLGKLHISRC